MCLHQFCFQSLQEIMIELKVESWNMFGSHLFLVLIYIAYRSGGGRVKFCCSYNSFIVILIISIFVMGNSLGNSSSEKKGSNPLPIDAVFSLPSPLPSWPTGEGFATGMIDLGGLQVRQISSFKKIWATYEGGPDNLGATIFEPSSMPDGFSMIATYAQPNNQPLFGWVLVAKTDASDQSGAILKTPTDYNLVYSTETNSQTGDSAYFWLPVPPDGFNALGYVITTSPEKPSLDKIPCVRSDFTDEPEAYNWIWGQGTEESANGLNIFGLRPKNRGNQAKSLGVGGFTIQNDDNSSPSLSCLKNNNFNSSSMPNLNQIQALIETYSPYIYFHPKEIYLPSSVNWYFSNGALLYKQGEETTPVSIDPNGSNLPPGGSNDGLYWLDLPVDETAKEKVKRGDLQSAEAYIHVKPMLGATFTDIQIWVFYPFNGPATAKVGIIDRIPLGKIGEHVADWEHVTLRISNFDGVLYRVYFSEHSGGKWVDSSGLEFQMGNKFVGYAALSGHPTFEKAGVVLQGTDDVGLRNDTAKSDMVMDTGARYLIVAAEGLSSGETVVEPPWLNYMRKWGPKISYKLESEVARVEKVLMGIVKTTFEKLVKSLPNEIYGEDGPTGPKVKNSWNGDEK